MRTTTKNKELSKKKPPEKAKHQKCATKENNNEISDKTQKKLVNVFVPTTPNPTSGFLLMFPKDEIIYLDMSFEEASKFIVSAGTSNPS